MPEKAREMTRLGVAACLRKPFDVLSLVGIVELYTQPSVSGRQDGREAA